MIPGGSGQDALQQEVVRFKWSAAAGSTSCGLGERDTWIAAIHTSPQSNITQIFFFIFYQEADRLKTR